MSHQTNKTDERFVCGFMDISRTGIAPRGQNSTPFAVRLLVRFVLRVQVNQILLVRILSIRVVANRPGIAVTLHSDSGPVVIPRLRQENRRRRDAHYHDIAAPVHHPASLVIALVTSAIGHRSLRSPRGFDFAAPSCMMKSSDRTTSTKERNHDREHHTCQRPASP